MRAPPVLGSALLAWVAFASACGAASAPSDVVRSPLEERATARAAPPRVTPLPPTPASGEVFVPPVPGALAPDSERATGQAIEYFTQALGVPTGELRLEAATALDAGGWRVTLRDAYGGRHAADVSPSGVTWVPQVRDAGTVALWRDASGLLVVDVRGTPLTLRVGRDQRLAVPPPGVRVAFGYDPSPRADGLPVLAVIEVAR
jgi:hypothetical protein